MIGRRALLGIQNQTAIAEDEACDLLPMKRPVGVLTLLNFGGNATGKSQKVLSFSTKALCFFAAAGALQHRDSALALDSHMVIALPLTNFYARGSLMSHHTKSNVVIVCRGEQTDVSS